MAKKIGVLLSGCGHRDGSEIHEATITLLEIAKHGHEAVCIAPEDTQRIVMNHLTGEKSNEKRNIRVEAARIARGKVRDITKIIAEDMDSLIIPGGQGAALNLSSFLIDGVNCNVEKDVKRLILDIVKSKKPLGAICIAPATVAKALEGSGITATITIGQDSSLAAQIEQMGARHEPCTPTNCVVDRENKIVTTPAYMNANTIAEVSAGIESLVQAVVEMCN